MSFFQNVFSSDFEGNWVLGDRQHSLKFTCPRNAGRGDEQVVAWKDGPYDLSGNDAAGNAMSSIMICYALRDPKIWTTLTVTLTTGVGNAEAVTLAEIVNNLNGDASFAARFTASMGSYNNSATPKIQITQKKPITEMRFYVVNGYAEQALGFNKFSGVSELPSYFDRHTMANRYAFTDSLNQLIKLDTGNAVDAAVINDAVDVRGNTLGYDSTDASEDWELLRGRSGIFNFQKITVDGSDRITQIIEYPAGAVAGDFARKIVYTYTAANKNPSSIFEVPYTLTASDLITP